MKRFPWQIYFYSSIVFFGYLASNKYFSKIKKPNLVIDRQSTALNINEFAYKYFSVGQKRMLSSLMWVKTMIDSDIEHYKGDLLNSWMYLRFLKRMLVRSNS